MRDAAPGARAVASYQLEAILDGTGTLSGWALTASAGGASLLVALPPESSVRGPVDGRITVAADDGARSQVRVVDPVRGCGDLVFETRDVVRSAMQLPGADAILFHAVGRADRADRGIWRRTSDGAAVTPVFPPVRAGDSLLEEIGPIWTTGLLADEGGQRLAVESCGAEDCRIGVARLGAESGLPGPAYPGLLVGLGDRQLLTLRDCDGLSCTLVSTDLDSRSERRLASDVASAATFATGGHTFALAAVERDGLPALLAIDPGDGRTWLAPASFVSGIAGPSSLTSVRLLPPHGDGQAGIEASPGWVGATVGSARNLVTLDARQILAGASMEAQR